MNQALTGRLIDALVVRQDPGDCLYAKRRFRRGCRNDTVGLKIIENDVVVKTFLFRAILHDPSGIVE